MSQGRRYCRNCYHSLTGEYCGHCGQREGRSDRRFLDLAGELTGDLLDFDSRLWRTLLFLLFRPGFLTAEFIAGRRARYLPPLRLYLVISFITFLVLSLFIPDTIRLSDDKAATGGEAVVVTIDTDSADGEESVVDPNDLNLQIGLAEEDSPQWLKDLEQRLESNTGRLLKDPADFVATVVEYLPQVMFLLLPVFALLVQLVYLLSPFHYLQHLVFALHYHSFAYLFYLFTAVLEVSGVKIEDLLMIGLLVYLPLAFRRCYGSSWWGAAGKALLVYISYALVLVLGFGVMVVVTIVLL